MKARLNTFAIAPDGVNALLGVEKYLGLSFDDRPEPDYVHGAVVERALPTVLHSRVKGLLALFFEPLSKDPRYSLRNWVAANHRQVDEPHEKYGMEEASSPILSLVHPRLPCGPSVMNRG